MKKLSKSRVFLFVAISTSAIVGFSSRSAHAEKDTPPAAVIRATPPAPVFDDAKRLEELSARRKHLTEAIGPKSMLVLFSAEPRVYTNDVDFPFRQEKDRVYLTTLNQM